MMNSFNNGSVSKLKVIWLSVLVIFTICTSCNNPTYKEIYNSKFKRVNTFGIVVYKLNDVKVRKEFDLIIGLTANYYLRNYKEDNLEMDIYSFRNPLESEEKDCQRLDKLKKYIITHYGVNSKDICLYRAHTSPLKYNSTPVSQVVITLKNKITNIIYVNPTVQQMDTVRLNCR